MASGFGALHQNRRGQMIAPNLRKIYPALFKYLALFHHPGAAAAPFGAIPGLFLKGGITINLLQPLTNIVLQLL
jgi:hypothetical protein